MPTASFAALAAASAPGVPGAALRAPDLRLRLLPLGLRDDDSAGDRSFLGDAASGALGGASGALKPTATASAVDSVVLSAAWPPWHLRLGWSTTTVTRFGDAAVLAAAVTAPRGCAATPATLRGTATTTSLSSAARRLKASRRAANASRPTPTDTSTTTPITTPATPPAPNVADVGACTAAAAGVGTRISAQSIWLGDASGEAEGDGVGDTLPAGDRVTVALPEGFGLALEPLLGDRDAAGTGTSTASFVAHTLPLHTPVEQSLGLRHALPRGHLAQYPPPQSTSLSAPPCLPSEHDRGAPDLERVGVGERLGAAHDPLGCPTLAGLLRHRRDEQSTSTCMHCHARDQWGDPAR